MPENITNPRWLVGRRLGGGGGGDVHICFHNQLREDTARFMQNSGGVSMTSETRNTYVAQHLEGLYRAIALDVEGLGALKIPKLLDDRNSERLRREIAAMQSFSHPGLIKLLDHDEEQTPKWFVMQYHPGGNLADSAAKYKGELLKSLLAIRSVIEGVAGLHRLGYVHRDIKPKNFFIAKDGALVLGDFGIVFPPGEGDARLTGPGDEIVSRDWIPDWMRFTETPAQPKADVFMLAKVIYFMISGGKKVVASQIEEPDFDLRRLLSDVPGIEGVYGLLTSCITTLERNCKPQDALELLAQIDELIDVLKGNYQTQLVFSFYSSHSTTHIPILTSSDAHTQYPQLRGLRVFLPCPCDEFRAFARVMPPGPTHDVNVSFHIDGHASNSVTIRGTRTDAGIWSEEIVLKLGAPLPRGLHTVDVIPVSREQAGQLSAFSLYAE